MKRSSENNYFVTRQYSTNTFFLPSCKFSWNYVVFYSNKQKFKKIMSFIVSQKKRKIIEKLLF